MKNYWQEVKLGDICEYSRNRISISEVNLCNYVSTENLLKERAGKTIADSIPEQANLCEYNKGCTLISNIRPYFKKIWFANTRGGCSNDVLVYKPNNGINDKWLYYLLSQDSFFNFVMSGTKGTKMPRGDKSQIMKFPVALPPLDEQRKIAGVLSALDDKIELNNKINRNLEAQAQAIFKSWFIDFEPFKNGKFIDSELGKIPEGWKVKELGKVSKNIREKVASRTNIPVLSAIKEGHLILSEEYFSKQVYSKSLSKYILVKENDYAYNPARVNIGSLGRNTICSLGCVSPVYVVFEIDDNYLAFFDLYFKMKSFKNEVKLRASGSVRQTLSYDDFSLIKVIYPPKSVSSKFNKLSAVLSEKIIRNKKESRSLAQLRDTLLPKLMSGEIDISNIAV